MPHYITAALSVLIASTLSWADPCPGDLDGDGLRDQSDLGILLASYEIDGGGDIDGDGDTDQSDLGVLLANYDFACPLTEMVVIPAGEFAMGDHYGDGSDAELPVHDVHIDSFWMDVYETTNQVYAAFLNASYPGQIKVVGGIVYGAADVANAYPYCDTNSFDARSRIQWDGSVFTVTPNREHHPMLYVSWYGAAAYSNWRSLAEGRQPTYNVDTWQCNFDVNGYRLPTEAEWEYAARGGEQTPYYKHPWGNTIDGSHANYWESGDLYETGPIPWTTPVGHYSGGQVPPGVDMANGYGLYDMAGNVWEWCNDWYDSTYYDSSPYDNPRGPAGGTDRVLRGGSWNNSTSSLRSAARLWSTPDGRDDNDGFRIRRNLN